MTDAVYYSDEDRLDWWITLLKFKRDIKAETNPNLKQRWINAYNWALDRYIAYSIRP